MSDLANDTKHKTFLGHPIGLYVLFFTEMWERFSYYGMRALLITYMVNYFKWTQSDASSVYKWYTTLVYVTPILGGFLADRYLGNTWAVIIGAGLMAVGHFLMAFEASNIFYAALILLIIGNGFFKPNMSTQVGRLYPPNDRRRDGAYTIFYMGINLGAFLSPLACGWLQENTVGEYHSGFALAGIGMVVGMITYLIGLPLIKEIPNVEIQVESQSKNSDQLNFQFKKKLISLCCNYTVCFIVILFLLCNYRIIVVFVFCFISKVRKGKWKLYLVLCFFYYYLEINFVFLFVKLASRSFFSLSQISTSSLLKTISFHCFNQPCTINSRTESPS